MYTYHWPEKLLRTENKILKRKLAKINVCVCVCVCVYECLYTVELFQILKYNAVKVMHSICHQIWKTQQWPQEWKRSVFIPIPKKGNPKECSNYRTIALISHVSKVMLKFSKQGFSNMWTVNFQMFKLVLEKAEEPEIKLPTSTGSSKKQESSRKTSISALLTLPKPLCGSQ